MYAAQDWKEGIKLSGGEQQKIVLSRAFAKNDSSLAIFDEPASNLDPESEHSLFKVCLLAISRSSLTFALQEIAAMKGRKTMIYISHRYALYYLSKL